MSRRLASVSSAFVLAAAASLLALGPSAAVAAPAVPFAQPSGSQPTFDYQEGGSANGNFGSPIVTPSGFVFAPPGLVASSTGSGEGPSSLVASATGVGLVTASDTASIILNAKPNTVFTRIGARLNGDYSIFGIGTVDSNATLRVYNLDAPASSPIVSPLVFTPAFPQGALGVNNGEFSAATIAAADVLPAGWRNVRVELDDAVLADALFGSAIIQTKGGNIDVETAAIPVPAAAAVAPLLGAMAWKARRRFIK